MKIRITKGGIYGADGEVAVGTELEFKAVPDGWDGRYEVISGDPSPAAVPIVNPADDDIEALRSEYLRLTGDDADKRWKENTLRDKIAAAKGE